MDIQQLLAYQEKDKELYKLQQEIAASEERKKYLQARKFMKSAGEKLEAQDARAISLKNAARDLALRVKKLNAELADYASLDEMVEEGGAISYYKKNIQALADTLRGVKAELQKVIADIETACEEYKKLKEQVKQMQAQYREYSDKYQAVKDGYADRMKKIEGELEKLGKSLPKEVVEKYAAKRHDVFPVVAEIRGGRCICGMDFPVAIETKLRGGEILECEHCRRIIFAS